MTTQRSLSPSLSSSKFIAMVARDIVRLAAETEGVERWAKNYDWSAKQLNAMARVYAIKLFGESEDACLFNSVLAIELDRRLAS